MPGHLLDDSSVRVSYVQLRDRVVELLRTTPESDGDLTVPHCPEWTVRELVSHIVGVPEDILAGRMEGVTTDAWTAAQVGRHRGETLAELADAFVSLAPRFDEVLPSIPAPINSQMVMDAVTHEHDLRHAIGRPGERDSLAVVVGAGWLRNRAEELAPGITSRPGVSDLAAFDFLRALGGRRSPEQMARLGIDIDRLSDLYSASPLRPPARDIDE